MWHSKIYILEKTPVSAVWRLIEEDNTKEMEKS